MCGFFLIYEPEPGADPAVRFLLAQLHLDSLVGKRSLKAFRNALKALPTGSDSYDHAYANAMERIEGQVKGQAELAKQVLSWVTCAERLLATLELRHALAVDLGNSELDEDNLPEIEDIVSDCAGLVVVDEESGVKVIRLVHYTAAEYFKRTQQYWFPNAETDITAICVTYLSFSIFKGGPCQTDEEFEERLRSNGLFDYAACNWGYHAGCASTLPQGVMEFLDQKAQVEAPSQALMAIKHSGHSKYSQEFPRKMIAPHLAAYFGVEEAADALLKRGVDVDTKDSDGRSPISYAAENGYDGVINLLLHTALVDTDSNDNNGRTPLLFAAEKGHEAVVKLLLKTGKISADSKDFNGRTPLLFAAGKGHEVVVKLLLETGGGDADSKDSNGRTPLSWAAESGHEAVVELLVARDDVEADSTDQSGRTPLSYAAESGHEAVVKLLQSKTKP